MFASDAVMLVTGASSGIGRATAVAAARAGVRRIAVACHEAVAEAEETAREVRQCGGESIVLPADVSDPAACDRLVRATVDAFGHLDHLVASAGVSVGIPHPDLDALTCDVWDGMLQVNLLGPFFCARAAAPHLSAVEGSIVNVASVRGLRPPGSSIPYGVSKAGLIQLTRHLAVALAPRVRVNAVAPGSIDTGFMPKVLGEAAAAVRRREVEATTPLGRIGSPDDAARAVLALLGLRHVTGQVLVVDGGKGILY